MSKRLRRVSVVVVALAGLLATAALAKTLTLKEGKHATVTNQTGSTTHPNIVESTKGLAVYTLSGDSAKHPECTSKICLAAWPPVKVKSRKQLSKGPGVKGKLGIWRHMGFNQVTIGGHPLYTFAGDSSRGVATGEGIQIPRVGTWHVRKASGGAPASAGATTPTPSGW